MVSANFILPQFNHSAIRTFKRRETLPPEDSALWQIETGAVRTFTFTEDATMIPLGFWGADDIVGQLLSRIQPYRIECLTEVKAYRLESGQFWRIESNQCWQMNQVMLAHIHQMQELLRIRSGQAPQRLQHLLEWLAYKFGRHTEHGQRIELRLTHQDIAEAIGTTRVTVTRLLLQRYRIGLRSFRLLLN
ncbi:MAG: Crp/Fnr family transcriptional regulator [Cyanobacteria bacterium RU_5_0]|nr:Crp/Fnr family transcriptional regulator [Cyanobacteria bacterium RU_5_0]